jgi:fibronectin type 3 domain-containing protein
VAEDDSKLLSPESSPVLTKAQGERKGRELSLKAKADDNENIILTWNVAGNKAVEKVIIYKSINDGQLQLAGSAYGNSFTDKISIDFGTVAKYRIKAIYKDGTSSDFSKEVKVVF